MGYVIGQSVVKVGWWKHRIANPATLLRTFDNPQRINPVNMKAWAGKPTDVLKLESDYPKPSPAGKKLLVEVHAVALNPVAWKTMGTAPLCWAHKKPAVPEADIAGKLVDGDVSGTNLKIGDEVIGFIPYNTIMKHGQGGLAEFTLVESHLVKKKPANVSFEEAASLPLTALTAWQALIDTGKLTEADGKRVFINGGSGGVGAYAVQIAKAFGAYVVTTKSESSKQLVDSLEPAESIDYKSVNLSRHLAENYSGDKAFDIVFDTVGVPELYINCARFIKPSGTFVDIAGPHLGGGVLSAASTALSFASKAFLPTFLGGNPFKYNIIMLKGLTMGDEFQQLVDLVAKGTVKPLVDSTHKFEDALQAYERQMSSRAKGKVIVKVKA
ncbi:hypothetical protein OIV83_006363 [Microbotryomycetes sp. JL201]|nr:hypothetical protein OIV83_006363 [Microbotryomycetes sp. JL201]